MRRERRRSWGNGVARWLLPALSLHVAAALVGAAWSRSAGPASARPARSTGTAAPAATSELVFLEDERPSKAPPAPPSTSFDDAPLRKQGDTRQAAAVAARPGSALRELGAAALPSSDSASLQVAAPTKEDSGASEVASVTPPPSTAVPLSLDQLGIGGNNPFLSPLPALSSEAECVQQRLQASLRQGSLEHERQATLGPTGDVVVAARRLVSANELLSETRAVVNIRVDKAGVASVDVLEASSQALLWQRVAADLLQAMGAMGPRLAASSEGFTLKLSLSSALRLPSGADPGLRLDLFGQTLKEGAGPGSASLSLKPTAPLPREKVFDSAGRQLDRPIKLEVGLLQLKWDVGDLGAAAQRVVQVAVLSLDTGAAP